MNAKDLFANLEPDEPIVRKPIERVKIDPSKPRQILLPEKIQINVTQEDIDNGQFDSVENNAACLAFRRALEKITKAEIKTIVCGIILWHVWFRVKPGMQFNWVYQVKQDTQTGFCWNDYCRNKVKPQTFLIEMNKVL